MLPLKPPGEMENEENSPRMTSSNTVKLKQWVCLTDLPGVLGLTVYNKWENLIIVMFVTVTDITIII